MLHSLFSLPKLPPIVSPGDAYRALLRVSNSDLTRLKEEHLGYWSTPSARFIPEKTKVFGRAFHQHLLEPETVGTVMAQLLPDLVDPTLLADTDALAPDQQKKLETLMQVIRQDGFCRRYLRQSERERIVLSTEPTTGVACKARLDMVYTSPKRRNALVIDLKTTSARTQAQFLESCYTYDYDRQAAFYLDSLHNADTGEWARHPAVSVCVHRHHETETPPAFCGGCHVHTGIHGLWPQEIPFLAPQMAGGTGAAPATGFGLAYECIKQVCSL